MAMIEKPQTKWSVKFTKKSSKVYSFRFNIEKDEDIIRMLNRKKKKTEYIRELIRKDIYEQFLKEGKGLINAKRKDV